MLASTTFYENGLGDRLADPSKHPQNIIKFLQVEQQALDSITSSIDLTIEVGCMYGLHLDWAISQKKRYLGIDIVERYIVAGRQMVAKRGLSQEDYRFVVGDAEELAHVLEQQHLGSERSLLFFPFNSFGNMLHVERVIASLHESNLPFLISSYQTTEDATKSREEYYTRCGYKDIRYSNSEKGVCFSSLDGLYSIAYHPAYLRKLCSDHNLTIEVTLTQPINMFYTRDIHLT